MEAQTEQKETMTIDLEPTWESLCRAAQRGFINAAELMPACNIADKIRQAQKRGSKAVHITFSEKGLCFVEDVV